MPSEILKGLNKEQKEAVIHKKGPLLIIAGAGTGKTTVLTRRIAYLIEKGLTEPDEILALTFTEKAAQEMEERVDQLLPLGKIVQNISTFHSFCENILREEALEIGFDPAFRVLDTPAEWLFIFKHLYDFALDYFRPVASPYKFIQAITMAISRLKDEAIVPEKFEKRVEKNAAKLTALELKKLAELIDFYKKYEEFLNKNSLIDFGGLILKTIELFKKRPNILKRYQEKFKYILVDEFQDTNSAQNELVKILAGKKKNITVAADDDQAIYRFRGASIENVLDFEKNFPLCKKIVLKENFRSYQDILDPAYSLIQQNNPYRLEIKSGILKKLIGKRGSSGKPIYMNFADISEESSFIADKIEEMIKKEKRSLDDFAILARTNADIDFFRNTLVSRGIPFLIAGNRGLFEESAVRDLISFFKIIANPADNLHFFRFLSFEIFGLKEIDKIKILNFAKKNNISIYEALQDQKINSLFDEKTKKAFFVILKLIQEAIETATKKMATQIFVDFIIKNSGYFKNLEKKNDFESMRNLSEFFKHIEAFQRQSDDKTVFSLVDNLELMKEAGESPAKAEILNEKGAVKLMTIHAAKGLEFNVVFLVNLIKGRFPSRTRKDPIDLPEFLFPEKISSGNVHVQEERRLFYVGITRARDVLFLSSSDFTESKTKKIASPFIFEAGLAKKEKIFKKSSPIRFSIQGTKTKQEQKKETKPRFSFFSYSQLDDFLVCPLRCKYKYVFRVPVPKSFQLSFGNSIHHTLREFYKIFQKEKKVPPFSALKELYYRFWESDGYKSRKQEEARKEKGLEILKRHFQEAKKLKEPPIFIEKKFRFRLGEDSFIGIIDRIDPSTPCSARRSGQALQQPSGQAIDKFNKNVNIVDYKTGSVKKKREIDKIDKGPGLQVSIYAFGAKIGLGLKTNKFIFDYLEHNKKLITERDEKIFKDIEKALANLTKEIKKSDFKATPGYQQCKYCDFKDICDYAYKS